MSQMDTHPSRWYPSPVIVKDVFERLELYGPRKMQSNLEMYYRGYAEFMVAPPSPTLSEDSIDLPKRQDSSLSCSSESSQQSCDRRPPRKKAHRKRAVRRPRIATNSVVSKERRGVWKKIYARNKRLPLSTHPMTTRSKSNKPTSSLYPP